MASAAATQDDASADRTELISERRELQCLQAYWRRALKRSELDTNSAAALKRRAELHLSLLSEQLAAINQSLAALEGQ